MTRKVGSDGYIYVNGKREHRILWELSHGPLPKGWVVHHVNLDKRDNRMDNLIALPEWTHDKIHQEIRELNRTIPKDELLPIYLAGIAEQKRLEEELEKLCSDVAEMQRKFNRLGVSTSTFEKLLPKVFTKKAQRKGLPGPKKRPRRRTWR